jgi:hypothetical protein
MVSEDDESFVAAFTLRHRAPRVKSFNDRAAHHEMRKSSVASALGASVADRPALKGRPETIAPDWPSNVLGGRAFTLSAAVGFCLICKKPGKLKR